MHEDKHIPEEIEAGEDGDLYEHHRIVVDKGQSLLRIDKFLMDRLPNATRNKLQQAIDAEAVKVNDKPIKASYKVKPQDVITISLPEPPYDTTIYPENIPLNIVYEDDQVLVLNKPPAWWCTRPTRTGRARWSTPWCTTSSNCPPARTARAARASCTASTRIPRA
jgi:23S rRNA-/tRNA-specific pseudouridylate synthase